MNKTKIIFELCSDEGPFYISVAKELRDVHGWDVSVLTMGKRWAKELEREDFKTFNIGEYLQNNWDAINMDHETIAGLEAEYGDPIITSHVHGDRYIGKCDYETVVKTTVGQIKFLEGVFEMIKPDIFQIPGTAHGLHILIERICKKRGTIYMSAYSGRLISQIIFSTKYVETWKHADDRFEEIKRDGLSSNDKEWALKWVEKFKKGYGRPYYMGISWARPGIRYEFLKEFLIRIYRVYYLGHGRSDDYVTPNPFRSAYDGLSVIIKRELLKLFSPFEKPVKDEKYIFFPLHFQPEASTIIMAPEYLDQPSFVENLSRSIPLGYRLYIKEHPNSVGKRPKGYYQRLKENFNVRLIGPRDDTRKIIMNADLIVNLTGTVGMEAAIMGKKVLNCGMPPFRTLPFFRNHRDISTLKEIIYKYINDEYNYNEEDIYAYIIAIRDASYNGTHNLPHTYPHVMKKENISNVAKAIVKEYQYICERRKQESFPS